MPAALPIKGRLVGQNGNAVTRLSGLDTLPLFDQSQHLGFGFRAHITCEFGAAKLIGNVKPDIVGRCFARAFPGRACHCLLPRHARVKACTVNAQALGAQGILGQIIGKAIGIIELKRRVAGQDIARRHRGGRFIEQL